MPTITYYHDMVAADSPVFVGLGSVGTGGTVIGSPSTISGPTLDTSDFGYQFNGTTEYVESGFDGSINGTGAYTVEMWVMPASSGLGGYLVGADPTSGGFSGWSIQCAATGTVGGTPGLARVSYVMSGCASGYGTPGVIKATVWNQVVLVWDGSETYLYLNGVLVENNSASGLWVPDSLSPVLIAADGQPSPDAPINFFDGAIADVSFYNKPLSVKKILNHFQARAGTPAYPASSTFTGDYYPTIIGDNPLAYYRCDETAGAQAVDRSGNGHHGAYCLGDFALSQPGAIYDGDAAVLLQEPAPGGTWDGTPAGVACPIEGSSFTTQMSVEAWVDSNSLPENNMIACTSGDTPSIDGPGFQFFIDTSGYLNFKVIESGSGGATVTSPNVLPSGQYNHVVGTFDTNNIYLFVNGDQVASAAAAFAGGPWKTNLLWGFCGVNYDDFTYQFNGTIDELAIYQYPLTPGQVYTHYIAGLGPLPPPPTLVAAGNDQHYFLVKVYDDRGQLVDIPQSDIDSLELLDQINGGSATSTMSFIRDFNKVGAINYLWSVLVWVWNGRIPMPLNPSWNGYMVDIDQEKTRTLGKITVHLEGDQKQLDRAAVYEDVNPLVDGNPPLDAAQYILHLYNTYAPPGFCILSQPPTLFSLLPGQYEMMQLGQVIDTVLKTGRDDFGNLFLWRVDRDYKLQRTLLIEPDQNPNTVSGAKFHYIFANEMAAKYEIHTKYSEICNVITVQGGQDYITGLPVVGSYIDENSVTAYGAWEQILSVWQLISQDACNSYAESYLDIHGNAQANGEIELHAPNGNYRSGQWVQIWENGANTDVSNGQDGNNNASIKQMRIGSIRYEVGRSRIRQTLSPVAPTPYLDSAVYKLGFNSANNGVNQINSLPVNQQNNFVRSGGTASAT